jgi:putative transposase
MDECERRLEAIRRVTQGENVSDVCVDVGRSRPWYYKWRQRYRERGREGLEDQRGGHTPPQRTVERIRDLILEIRDRLVRQAEAGTHHLGIGADQIGWELEDLGLTPPSRRTIYRILNAGGRIARDAGPRGYRPRPSARCANDVHQLDLWPRVLEGGTFLFLLHLVDVASWYPCGAVSADKCTDSIIAFLLASWQRLGVPRVLQMDNEMSFTGGRWAYRLGRLARLTLLLGGEVWFNPFHMPKCNAYVERFHGLCDQFFWSRHRFSDPTDVACHYPAFLETFRERYRAERLAHQTPADARQTLPDNRVGTLPEGLAWTPGRSVPLVAGRVHCVRQTDRYGRLEVLRRHFALGSQYRHAYIRATLTVAEQQVAFYYQETADAEPELVSTQPFPLPNPVQPWEPSLITKYLAQYTD